LKKVTIERTGGESWTSGYVSTLGADTISLMPNQRPSSHQNFQRYDISKNHNVNKNFGGRLRKNSLNLGTDFSGCNICSLACFGSSPSRL